MHKTHLSLVFLKILCLKTVCGSAISDKYQTGSIVTLLTMNSLPSPTLVRNAVTFPRPHDTREREL